MLKNKVVIGIIPTYSDDETNPYKDIAYFCRMFEKRFEECGALAIGLLHNDLSVYKDICDAYLWPGGNVIRKDFYIVFEDIIKNNKPLLGICMGSQAIATFFNVLDDQLKQPNLSLMEVYDNNKLDNVYLKKIEGDSLTLHANVVDKSDESINKAKHKIFIEKNTFMYDIYKEKELDVVSLHSFEIARTSKDTIVSAKSKDGVIEAVEIHKNNLKILGLQYHPEVIKDHKPFIWLIEQVYKKYQILINKDNRLKETNFKIIYYNGKYPKLTMGENGIEEQTYYAFMSLKKKMEEYGYVIDLESGYRTAEMQEKIYNQVEKEKGSEHAKKYVARPGYSEHQSGLAVDVCAYVNGKWVNEFDIPNELYDKMHNICSNYGFILRYPKDKEQLTGYNYEPWHLRYVGDIGVAKNIMDNNFVLEDLDVNR